jgi:hypothetical protein
MSNNYYLGRKLAYLNLFLYLAGTILLVTLSLVLASWELIKYYI